MNHSSRHLAPAFQSSTPKPSLCHPAYRTSCPSEFFPFGTPPQLFGPIYIYISGFSASFWYHVMDAAFLTRKKWHIAGTPPASSSPFSCQEDGFTPRSRNMRRQFWTLFHQLSWSTDASKWSTDGSCFSDLTASPGHG